jgi:outer membrane lipoprotein SlyB
MMNRTLTNRVLATAVAAVAGAMLAGCIEAPPPRPTAPPPPQAQAPPPQAQAAPAPNSDVYAYPLRGQSPQQQDRDHYECSTWATQQTGFDPSAPGVPPQHQVHVVSGPAPGSGTAAGVVTGAILGAIIGGPYHAAGPALAGAVVGGAIGTAAEASARQSQTITVTDQRALAQIQQRANNYRRALSACLDARGYSVK